jgi:hypothetical protein
LEEPVSDPVVTNQAGDDGVTRSYMMAQTRVHVQGCAADVAAPPIQCETKTCSTMNSDEGACGDGKESVHKGRSSRKSAAADDEFNMGREGEDAPAACRMAAGGSDRRASGVNLEAGSYVEVLPQPPKRPCGVPGVDASAGDACCEDWLQGWQLRVAGGVPQQRDGGSCGVFSLAFADCILRGWWPGVDASGATRDAGVQGSVPVAMNADEKYASEKKDDGDECKKRMNGSCKSRASTEKEECSSGVIQPVRLEFGEVAALRLGLLQELTSCVEVVVDDLE